jgi:hypothetical protein
VAACPAACAVCPAHDHVHAANDDDLHLAEMTVLEAAE